MNRNRIWLCLMPIGLFALDITLTLCGQPAAYWGGDFSRALEGSPEVRRVMQIHPLLLYAMIVAWVGVVTGLIFLLPKSLAEWFALTVVLGHSIAASSWFHRHFGWKYDYQLKMGLALLVSAGWCACHWRSACETDPLRGSDRRAKWTHRIGLSKVLLHLPVASRVEDAHGGRLRTDSASSSRWHEHSRDSSNFSSFAAQDSKDFARRPGGACEVRSARKSVGSETGTVPLSDSGDSEAGRNGSSEAASHGDAYL